MTVFVTEHQGDPHRQVAANRPLAAYSLTSAGPSTLSAGAQYVVVTADGGSYLGVYASTTAALTSTNSFRIPANVAPQVYGVSTSFKLQAQST